MSKFKEARERKVNTRCLCGSAKPTHIHAFKPIVPDDSNIQAL